MTIDNKVAYRVTLALVSILALIGAVMAVADFIRAALVFLGLAVATMPILSHIRMREHLAAIRRMPQSSGTSFDSQPFLDQMSSIERLVGVLTEQQNAIQHRTNADTTKEFQDAVNQLRREARMSRIAAAKITGKL